LGAGACSSPLSIVFSIVFYNILRNVVVKGKGKKLIEGDCSVLEKERGSTHRETSLLNPLL
jgi:hypothetical protein